MACYCYRRSAAVRGRVEIAILTANTSAATTKIPEGGIIGGVRVQEKDPKVAKGCPEKKRTPMGTLANRELAIRNAQSNVVLKSDPTRYFGDGCVRRHAVRVPRAISERRRFFTNLAKEACRLVYINMTDGEGSWVIGMLLGELTPAETRDFGASASSKLVFAELYTVGRTLSAVYRTQQ